MLCVWLLVFVFNAISCQSQSPLSEECKDIPLESCIVDISKDKRRFKDRYFFDQKQKWCDKIRWAEECINRAPDANVFESKWRCLKECSAHPCLQKPYAEHCLVRPTNDPCVVKEILTEPRLWTRRFYFFSDIDACITIEWAENCAPSFYNSTKVNIFDSEDDCLRGCGNCNSN